MEFTLLSKERRSVRKFIDANLDLKDLEEIIKCSQLAPSWKNSQTARYYVALSKQYQEMIYNALPDFNQNSSKNAYYIVTTFKKDVSGKTSDGMIDGQLWGAYDLGLHNAYLILKAKELGYDTLIMGLRDVDRIKEIFNIPDDEIIMSVIAIGKKDGEVRFNPRKELEEILVVK